MSLLKATSEPPLKYGVNVCHTHWVWQCKYEQKKASVAHREGSNVVYHTQQVWQYMCEQNGATAWGCLILSEAHEWMSESVIGAPE